MSTLDADGCDWICLSPSCPELAAEELVEAGVPEALAGRLARLVDQEARQTLAAVGALCALCAVLRRTAADAQQWAAGIDAELPGLLAAGEF